MGLLLTTPILHRIAGTSAPQSHSRTAAVLQLHHQEHEERALTFSLARTHCLEPPGWDMCGSWWLSLCDLEEGNCRVCFPASPRLHLPRGWRLEVAELSGAGPVKAKWIERLIPKYIMIKMYHCVGASYIPRTWT